MGNERWTRRQFVGRAGKTAGGVVLGLSLADFLAACGTGTGTSSSGTGKLEIFSWWTGPGEKDGLADNTVILFFGDHGQAHVRGKQFCYDSGLNTPLIIYWPAKVPTPQYASTRI